MTYYGKTYGNASCRPIGIYVDHHGEGHRQRAIAIAKQAPGYFTLLGTGLKGKSDALPIVELPDEPCFDTASPLAEKKFSSGNRLDQCRRLQRIADWIDVADPPLLLIDSCVEVAILARLKGVPTVYMRLSGKRNDPAHLRAFASAEAVLCPFHPLLESDATPQWLRAHSHYFPGLTQKDRFAQTGTGLQNAAMPQEPVLLIIAGHDCSGKKHIAAKAAQLIKAAQALPDWQIQVIGQSRPKALEENCPANLHFHGWVERMEDFIGKADLIVGAASDCLISAVAAAGKPFICMPQQRPFDEQYEKAERLAKLHAATICRKWPRNWRKTVRKALKHGSVLAALHDDNAPARAAEFLLDMAYGSRQTIYGASYISGGLAASLGNIGRKFYAGATGAISRPFAPLWQKHAPKLSRPRKAA